MHKIHKIIISALIAAFAASCGVKNDPIPPETPAEMGRGHPNYKEPGEPDQKPVKKQKKDSETDDE